MKQLLYLDIDIVNSIITQAEKGLVGELSSEHSRHDDTTKADQGKIDLSGEVGGSLL